MFCKSRSTRRWPRLPYLHIQCLTSHCTKQEDNNSNLEAPNRYWGAAVQRLLLLLLLLLCSALLLLLLGGCPERACLVWTILESSKSAATACSNPSFFFKTRQEKRLHLIGKTRLRPWATPFNLERLPAAVCKWLHLQQSSTEIFILPPHATAHHPPPIHIQSIVTTTANFALSAGIKHPYSSSWLWSSLLADNLRIPALPPSKSPTSGNIPILLKSLSGLTPTLFLFLSQRPILTWWHSQSSLSLPIDRPGSAARARLYFSLPHEPVSPTRVSAAV